MSILLKVTFLFLSFSFCSASEPNTAHREHSAHVHGAATLGIAFEKNIGKIEFKAPSESIYGFEHVAKSKKDKKIQSQALLTLKEKITEIITFSSDLKCLFAKEKIELIKEKHEEKNKAQSGEHSDVEAEFQVTCEKSPVGSQVIFNFQKHFPKLKDIDVQLLADDIQMSFELKKSGTPIDIK